MKPIDRALQRWRIAQAGAFIHAGDEVLDVGCADGELFHALSRHIRRGVGIDPRRAQTLTGRWHLVAGRFPYDMPRAAPFDVITMLAVLEHIPPSEQTTLAVGCARFLKPGGRLVVTVPSPQVDLILAGLKALRLIDGMSLEEHHGFDANQTLSLFAQPDFRLAHRRTFQLGLNNLFVFERQSPGHDPGITRHLDEPGTLQAVA